MNMKEKLEQYEEMFGESFPTFPFIHLSPIELESIITACLVTGKSVYDLGYISDNEHMNY